MSETETVDRSYAERVGLTLQTLRKFRGFNQRDVAKKSGVTQSMLSQYERGTTVPNLESLDKVLAALNADLGTFHQYRTVVYLLQDDPSLRPPEPGVSAETTLRQVVDGFQIFLQTLRVEALHRYLQQDWVPRKETDGP